METSVFEYLPIFKVLLCKVCPESYYIPPDGIATHLRDFHQNILTKKQRAALIEYANSLDLLHPDDVKSPPREHGLVEGLHYMDGVECLECGYVCGSENTMKKKHCGPKH